MPRAADAGRRIRRAAPGESNRRAMTIGIALSLRAWARFRSPGRRWAALPDRRFRQGVPDRDRQQRCAAGFQVMTRYLVLTIRFDHIILWSSVPAPQASV
jgi:hypothetical protein